MLVSKNNFVPIVFPPGAGGHFFWQLLSIHPDIMPMGKDQTMQKLFLCKNVHEQSERINKLLTSDHNAWQTQESHDYYIAPPDYSKQQQANWQVDSHSIDFTDGDEYFFDKIHKTKYYYSMVVHNTEQFQQLDLIDKCIVFTNYDTHISNSKRKIQHISNPIANVQHTNGFVVDVDRFFYDWIHASVELYLIFEYIGLWLDKDVRDAIEQSWNVYRSIH